MSRFRNSVICLIALALVSTSLSGVYAQTRSAERHAMVEGRVLDPDGLGVPGVTLQLDGGNLPAPRQAVSEGADGAFRFEGVPANGEYTLSAGGTGIYQPARIRVSATGEGPTRVDVRLSLGFSEEVTVTEAREGRLKKETPATVDTVDRELIEELKPTHPGQVMSQVPGVWVNTTGGEGHQTAIRQPLTTSPVYLYLEDGVPTRSTGFFNHNALYEVNVPAAEGIEVTKGPGSALYGSDAIGGVVNVVTRGALGPPAFSFNGEAGGHGWLRGMVGGSARSGLNGVRADLNLTHTDGWRDATGYDRQTGTLRWDRVAASGSAWKTMLAFSNIDQQTAGSSALQEDDYLSIPTRNLTPISFRDVQAVRVSTEYQRVMGGTSLNVIPYFRYDTMGLLANWTLNFDPTVSDTSNTSYGVLAKVRRSSPRWRTDVVAGVDFDFSPGGRVENVIVPQTVRTPNNKRIFQSYNDGPLIYDYDVTYAGISPYAQVDFSPVSRLRVNLGLRFDTASYDYEDNLTTPVTPRYLRPEDAVRRYTHLSPKLGMTYQFTDELNAFASYRHAFRTPSEGQLFRQGSARNTIDLEPVKADNYEVGLRARPSKSVSFEASVYRLVKNDDILSFRDPFDGLTQNVNAGQTLHQGVELGVSVAPASWIRAAANYSRAKHTYEEWVVDPLAGIDYSGREMETAPANLANVYVTLMPGSRFTASAEVSHIGNYWMDAPNTQTYGGHTLVNLRGQVSLTRQIAVFARVLNLTDRLYAESSSFTIQRGREFAPGMPRTGYVGLTLDWKR
jgi:outer membrane receptor protein involved in Fe transport